MEVDQKAAAAPKTETAQSGTRSRKPKAEDYTALVDKKLPELLSQSEVCGFPSHSFTECRRTILRVL